MIWKIEITPKDHSKDTLSQEAKETLKQAGFNVSSVFASRIYLIEADVSKSLIYKIARDVFQDTVLEELRVEDASIQPSVNGNVILVFRKPGVMDPVEESTIKAIKDVGYKVSNVRIGTKYLINGRVNTELCKNVLANNVVDQTFTSEQSFNTLSIGSPYKFKLIKIPHNNITKYLKQLSLNGKEIKAIKDHFKRSPTDVELETIAQTWSEHCKHKTFNSRIEINGQKIDNLFKETIVKATEKTKSSLLVSVFKDNAGIIRYTKNLDLAVKVETHNHPSAIEPYGGSNTGMGGVIRDILGAGLGARPIASIDVFAVAEPDCKPMVGTIDPKILLNEVVAGVRDYGNKMGIPTVCGSVYYDNRFLANPLVYCGVVGVLPKSKSKKKVSTGDVIVLAGGRTGRDGIHGATFSSGTLDETSQDTSQEAVQIGNAIVEKKLLDFIIDIRDKSLFTAITDCGAGGLSSAVGEIAEKNGALVHIERAPLKYLGLSYREIWISEAQERMVIIVPKKHIKQVFNLAAKYDVEITQIGNITDTDRLVLYYKNNKVCDLDMDFLHNGLPKPTIKATWQMPNLHEPNIKDKNDQTGTLLKLLSSHNIKSKEWIIRQYDHEVQGHSVIKPLCGKEMHGPSDGVIIRSPDQENKGVAIGIGINPRYADINPYDMAALVIDESVRNIVACGANPSKITLLDNFCWGNVNDPQILGALVQACFGCRDTAIAYGTPFISGKDSLHNTYLSGKKLSSIPHTLLITATGIVDSVDHCVSMDAKGEGHIYIIGVTKNELGGSEFYKLHGKTGSNVPKVDLKAAPSIFNKLHQAIRKGIVRACHDVSEGGIAVALAEMCIAGKLGADVDLSRYQRNLTTFQVLFSESPTRFIVETNCPNKFEKIFSGVPAVKIGKFKGNSLKIKVKNQKVTVNCGVEKLLKYFITLF